MKILKSLEDIPKLKHGILTIGTFDGLHKGHRQIIDEISACKKSNLLNNKDTKSLVLTFSNHPKEILLPELRIKKLCTNEYKLNFFSKKGIDYLIFINFDNVFGNIGHEEFFKKVKSKIALMEMVQGDNFCFGRGGRGDIKYLKQMAKKYKERQCLSMSEDIAGAGLGGDNAAVDNFRLHAVELVGYAGVKVSSTRIRELVQEGDIVEANELLERDYSVEGRCIEGERLGQKIGFPTINIINEEMVIPKGGVYKTYTELERRVYYGMTFIGDKSLGNKRKGVIETNLFDFGTKCYGKKVRVYFQERLRSEKVFKDVYELYKQLQEDKKEALKTYRKGYYKSDI